MHRLLAIVSAGIALAGWAAAQEKQTGTQPGQTLPGPFPALVVTGPALPKTDEVLSEERRNLGDPGRVGKVHDFVTRYGLDPTVAVFSREAPPAPDQPLGQLLKALDEAVQKNARARLRAFGVFLTLRGEYFRDEAQGEQVKQIQAFGQQLQLTGVPLALAQAESPQTKAFGIAPGHTVTVLVYDDQIVRNRLEFTPDKALDEAGVKAVLDAVNSVVARRR
jgi:hypothetical protein